MLCGVAFRAIGEALGSRLVCTVTLCSLLYEKSPEHYGFFSTRSNFPSIDGPYAADTVIAKFIYILNVY